MDRVSFLRFVVSARGVDVDSRRIGSVKSFPIPKNPSDVRSFHGLCSYNRKFIQGFADIAKPLTHLMGKPTDLKWTAEAQKAFETLRDKLIEAPTLVHFNPDADHELRTDASFHAIGAVLFQGHEDRDRNGVVLYYSKTLNAAQRNYFATERELLAAYSAIMAHRYYLPGKRFKLVTDHAALTLLNNQKDLNRKPARWVADLQAFEFDVVYKSGARHLDADCMSRFIEETSIESENHILYAKEGTNITRACSLERPTSEAGEVFEESYSFNIREEQRQDQFCQRHS